MRLLLIGLCLSVPFLATAQDDDDSKGIKAERFMKARPADKSRSTATYRRARPTNTGASVRPKGIDVAEVGIDDLAGEDFVAGADDFDAHA